MGRSPRRKAWYTPLWRRIVQVSGTRPCYERGLSAHMGSAVRRRVGIGIFVIGIGLLILVCAVTIYLPCPTVSQIWPLQVSLALAGGMVAGTIPGRIVVSLPKNSALVVRASGAIAVFVLLLELNPLLSKQRLESTFSNASCQGFSPTQGLAHGNTVVASSLSPQSAQPIRPDDALGRPIHFSVDYTFQPDPGIRDWTQVKPGVWFERYPNGQQFTAFREKGRTTLDGCPGSVLERTSEQGADVFIPDKGCSLMWVRFRQLGSQQWQWFQKMQDVL